MKRISTKTIKWILFAALVVIVLHLFYFGKLKTHSRKLMTFKTPVQTKIPFNYTTYPSDIKLQDSSKTQVKTKIPFDYTKCPPDIKLQDSLTTPKHYPENGTGETVDNDVTFPSIYMEKICQTSPPYKAILPIYSAVTSAERRMDIRNTIGKECLLFNCKVVFICGISKDEQVMQNLLKEYVTYADIVMVYKIDTYKDLSDKAVGMLDWLLNHCQQPRYVIHFVDDTYVNIQLFYEDIEKSGDSILGAIEPHAFPFRRPDIKFYISLEMYPYTRYPAYVAGMAYGFPNTLTHRLRCAVPYAIYNWLEDVWLTGHVRETAGIKATHTTRREQRYGPPIVHNDFNTYLYKHSVGKLDFYKIYNFMQEYRSRNKTALT